MRTSTITSVIADDNPMRCITASVQVIPGDSDLAVRGVTDSASDEIRKLVLDAARRRGFNLPNGAITVSLDFDVPFEKTSELAFATIAALLHVDKAA